MQLGQLPLHGDGRPLQVHAARCRQSERRLRCASWPPWQPKLRESRSRLYEQCSGQRRLSAAAVSRSHDVKHLPVIVPHSCLPSPLAKCVPWRLIVIDRRWHEMEASCSCGCTAGPAVLKASIVQRKGSKFLSCILSFLTGDTMVSLPYLALLPLCAVNVHSAGSHVQASIRCMC